VSAREIRFYLGRATSVVLIVGLLTGLGTESSKRKQASILARVLSYELTLEERMGDRVGVAVVYRPGDPASEASADDWMLGLADLNSVKIKDRPFFAVKVPFRANELNAAIDNGADVLLAAAGLTGDAAAIAAVAGPRHVLTVGDSVPDVQTYLTVCVTVEADKPKIYINLTAARLARIRFSSRLLGLATLIR
jgi:hypothetical protein